jgi:putative hydrolase of HD superfamily
LSFIHLTERLKFTLRHGWTSNGRQESVAEHSWRLALLAILVSPYLECSIDMQKTLEMAIIHDLCEVLTGDTPFFEAPEGSEAKQKKQALEKEAMQTLLKLLDNHTSKRLNATWQEYLSGESEEAKFIHALDKIEAQIQQNEADFSTWNDFEKQSIFTYLDKFCDYNQFIKTFKEEVKKESIFKLKTSLQTLTP